MACAGSRLVQVQLPDPILAARMGAPSTINLITPLALLALPLHTPRLISTLRHLGLLSHYMPSDDPAAQLSQAGASSAAQQLVTDGSAAGAGSKVQPDIPAAGLWVASGIGPQHAAACQGLQDGEVLVSAAWEESLLAGSKGLASKGPGIIPRALVITSHGDLVRLAMLPGPQGTSRCQVCYLVAKPPSPPPQHTPPHPHAQPDFGSPHHRLTGQSDSDIGPQVYARTMGDKTKASTLDSILTCSMSTCIAACSEVRGSCTLQTLWKTQPYLTSF